MAGGVRVVTVAGVADVAGGLTARAHARTAVPVPVTVAIGVPDARVGGGLFVRFAIAIVVHAVADLGRIRALGRVEIVAVGRVADVASGLTARAHARTAVPVPVTVAIGVPDARVHGVVLIGRSVAIVVHAVAGLGRVGVDLGERVVAVGRVADVASRDLARGPRRARVAVPVTVAVGVPNDHIGGGVFVRFAIAVVVLSVAHLGRAGIDRHDAIVTVGRIRDVADRLITRDFCRRVIAVPVTVAVRVPDQGIDRIRLVGQAVAVVIHRVAHFRGAEVGCRVTVIAVVRVLGVSLRELASFDGARHVTLSVAVAVSVERGGHALVNGAVAVVVRAVADLGRIRTHIGTRIIAVGIVADVAVQLGVGHPVALGDDFGRSVTAPVAIVVLKPCDTFIRVAVAVVVNAIAGLGRARVDARVRVVAIVSAELVRVVAVAIGIGDRRLSRVARLAGLPGFAGFASLPGFAGVRVGIGVRIGIGVRVGVSIGIRRDDGIVLRRIRIRHQFGTALKNQGDQDGAHGPLPPFGLVFSVCRRSYPAQAGITSL